MFICTSYDFFCCNLSLCFDMFLWQYIICCSAIFHSILSRKSLLVDLFSILHPVGILLLLNISSCAGVSLKTQELYAIVFATRYLDLFTTFISIYNTILKLIFLGSSFSIVWYMRHHKIVRRSYDKQHDTFRHLFLIIPCLLLALVINDKFTFKEVPCIHQLGLYDMLSWIHFSFAI